MVIPAFNEAPSISKVIQEIPKVVSEIIVVDNNSSDDTYAKAIQSGAIALKEQKKGYGWACLCGIHYITQYHPDTDIVVFLDGDYSDYPEDLIEIVKPIIEQNFDFVIGARVKELREPHSMTPHQIFGNKLATFLMRIMYNGRYTDLGPFRAIKFDKLLELQMEDKTYGWTVEMQLKALKKKFKYQEIPVRYKNRIGVSKVSGTVRGSIGAGIKILGWIFKYAFK